MKKTLSILLIALLSMMLLTGVVNAAQDFKVALTSSVNRIAQGDTVVVTVTLKDFKSNETGISKFSGVIDYDRTVFETVQSTDLALKTASGWAWSTTAPYNESTGAFSLTNSSFMKENHEVFEVTLKAKANATIGNTVITFTSLNGDNDETAIYPVDQKITLTITSGTATTTPEPTNSIWTTPTPTPLTTPTNNSTNENSKMPNTGVEDYILPSIAVVSVIAIFAYVRYNRIDK